MKSPRFKFLAVDFKKDATENCGYEMMSVSAHTATICSSWCITTDECTHFFFSGTINMCHLMGHSEETGQFTCFNSSYIHWVKFNNNNRG